MLIPPDVSLNRAEADRIRDRVLGDTSLLPELMETFFAGEEETIGMAGMVMGLVARAQPVLLQHYQRSIYEVCQDDPAPGVLRNGIRFFSELPVLVEDDFQPPPWLKRSEGLYLRRSEAIPGQQGWLDPSLEGLVLDWSLGLVDDHHAAVAARVFAMVVVQHMLPKYPEIASEVEVTVSERMDGATAGFRSRGRKLLAIINRMG